MVQVSVPFHRGKSLHTIFSSPFPLLSCRFPTCTREPELVRISCVFQPALSALVRPGICLFCFLDPAWEKTVPNMFPHSFSPPLCVLNRLQPRCGDEIVTGEMRIQITYEQLKVRGSPYFLSLRFMHFKSFFFLFLLLGTVEASVNSAGFRVLEAYRTRHVRTSVPSA